ncbi:MAG TPA: aldehyde dehydrogenase family protein [Polyangiaceae bacterium]|nr:aldehyde dehydrogenase family protein [Polyangiaceae bacterium]
MSNPSLLSKLGIDGHQHGACWGEWIETTGDPVATVNPTTEEVLASLPPARPPEAQLVLAKASERFAEWRMRPAPARGEVVRQLGEKLRAHKAELGELISLEVGKIRSEGLGEVQEMIDICDFAVGLSRQLYGLSMHSERPRHRMFEQWHPAGPVGVITAFNFPMAVWAWNAAIAAVCGDVVLWKPSEHAALCALAIQRICNEVMKENDCQGVFNVMLGGADVGEWIAANKQVPIVSFTGSIPVGRKVAARVAGRLGKSILELGGNNGIIVMDDANLDIAMRAITFGAVGTAGQRCTSTRRVFAHTKVFEPLAKAITKAYGTVKMGDPREDGTLLGPLISARSVEAYEAAIAMAKEQGGEVLCGGEVPDRRGFFVTPTVIKAPSQKGFPIAWEETFAPILYLFEVDGLESALEDHNAVTQGLSSAIFTDSLSNAETFLSARGSDCGIANVNIGTSGAEIGGAFGGEKDTGGGREAGSDAWKAYMRRQTCTVNWGGELPLAQGVEFDVG